MFPICRAPKVTAIKIDFGGTVTTEAEASLDDGWGVGGVGDAGKTEGQPHASPAELATDTKSR
jgi:hypothetical protein